MDSSRNRFLAVVAISTKDTQPRPSGVSTREWVTRNIDLAAVELAERKRIARETAERVATLRHIVFRNAASNRNVVALKNESAAARLLISAGNSADGLQVLAIVQLAIDNRWHSVTQAGIRYFGEHPVADRIQELWDLTTDRSAV